MKTGGSDEDMTTEDRLLGGRVRLRQSRDGYRAAIDPVLLAAAVNVREGASVLDAGSGAGAVSLCLLARRPDLRLTGIEVDGKACALAEANAAMNGVGDRLHIRCGSLGAICSAMAAAGEQMDAVVTNPPYLTEAQADLSPSPDRQRSNVESQGPAGGLAGWIAACARPLRRKGALTLVHRADRLDDAILALRAAEFGEIVILPLWPHAGREARRVLVRARKGVAGPARLLPGLVLHQTGGGYTPAAESILRDAMAIGWAAPQAAADDRKVSTIRQDSPS